MTYPAVYGMEASIQCVKSLTDEAIENLNSVHLENDSLKKVAYYLVQRTK